MNRAALLVPALVLGLAACQASDSPETVAGAPVAGAPVADVPVANVPVPAPLALEGDAYDAALAVTLPERAPEDHPGLHKVFRLSDRIISGAEPHGEEALRKLSGMGVKTILCVDGKAPDVETAARFGMRYVHLPIQYKGITDEELTRMTKMFRELDGPFYVHCFHGAHRGPTAAAIGRIVVDGAPREQALAEMRQWAGASGSYHGLYEAIATADVPPPEQTAAHEWDFPGRHRFDGVRGAMVPISRSWDHLVAAEARGWEIDPAHPDVDPRNEADKLAGAFAQCNQIDGAAEEPDDFRRWMAESEQETVRLRDALARAHAHAHAHAGEGGGAAKAEASARLKQVKSLCKSCHAPYRNN